MKAHKDMAHTRAVAVTDRCQGKDHPKVQKKRSFNFLPMWAVNRIPEDNT